MERIYISGKITGLENPEEIFNKAEKILTEQGFEVVNPMKLNHSNHDKSWEEFMKVDLHSLLHCDSIYMLKNWHKSKGARLERIIAKELNMKIYHQTTWQK